MDLAERLAAVEDLKRLKARYCRFLDDKQWDNYLALFCADAICSFRDMRYEKAADFVAHVRARAEGSISVHQCHMPDIDVTTPTQATGIWLMSDRVEFAAGSARTSFHGFCRYHEKYRFEDGQWRISEMQHIRLGEVDVAEHALLRPS
jgi:hypothetical protein